MTRFLCSLACPVCMCGLKRTVPVYVPTQAAHTVCVCVSVGWHNGWKFVPTICRHVHRWESVTTRCYGTVSPTTTDGGTWETIPKAGGLLLPPPPSPHPPFCSGGTRQAFENWSRSQGVAQTVAKRKSLVAIRNSLPRPLDHSASERVTVRAVRSKGREGDEV